MSFNENTSNLLKGWFTGGLANAISSSILNPMDVIKTRMQADIGNVVNNVESIQQQKIKPSLLRTGSLLYKEGGLIGLWTPGLSASIAREFLYSGPRAGLYVPVRDFISECLGDDDKSEAVICKIVAALTTGNNE